MQQLQLARLTTSILTNRVSCQIERWALVLVFAVTGGILLSRASHGQALPVDARLVHIINFQAGVVKAQWIPYGRRWAIQGTTMKVENEILAVVGEIHARGGKDRQASCWTVPPDVNTDVFRLVFDPLEIGRRYDVSLDFYGAFDVNILTPALDRAYRETVNLAEETYPFVRQPDIRDLFTNQVEEELVGIFDNEDVILLRNIKAGDCEIVTRSGNANITASAESANVPFIDFDPVLINNIAESVLTEVRTSRRTSTLNDIEDQNRQLLGDPLFGTLLERLREEERRDYGFLEVGDANMLRNSLSADDVPSQEVVARLYATGFACRTDDSFPADQCELLNDIVDRSYEYVREVSLASTGEEEYKPIRSQMLRQLGEQLSEVYTPVANTRINAMQWDNAPSTSDRIQIGTSVGLGVAALNLTPRQLSEFDVNQAESFLIAALKFYPFAIDKTLPSPYMGREFFARSSLVVGVLVKRNLSFEGQRLNTVAAGLYPVFGGGFDITKNITLQAGAVFFRQPSFRFNEDSSEFKAAPMISLAFDFDGINRLRDAFRGRGNDPYPQP